MVEKCKICSEKIQETFLEKPKGTIIKIKTEKIYICSDCQKKYKERIKERIK